MRDFFLKFDENYRLLREHIIQCISSQEETSEEDNPQDAAAIFQKRVDFIDGVLLGALNSHDEAATEALCFCARYQGVPGLPRILHQLFNSDAELKSVSPPT